MSGEYGIRCFYMDAYGQYVDCGAHAKTFGTLDKAMQYATWLRTTYPDERRMYEVIEL